MQTKKNKQKGFTHSPPAHQPHLEKSKPVGHVPEYLREREQLFRQEAARQSLERLRRIDPHHFHSALAEVHLTEIEREVFRLRHLDERPLSHHDTARKVHLPIAEVKRIEQDVLEKMKNHPALLAMWLARQKETHRKSG